VHYYELFSRLRQEAGHGGSNPVYAVQSLFFASMFHCVDNVPHPIAHALFAEAQARCFDAGIHRSIPATVSDEVGHEMRSVSRAQDEGCLFLMTLFSPSW